MKERQHCALLAKVFDIVDHNKFIETLESVGVRGVKKKLFETYLENRTQCVKVVSNISEKKVIKYGVPQETILRLILLSSIR